MFGTDQWQAGDWVLLPATVFDGCTWGLRQKQPHTLAARILVWAVVANVRPQSYRGRKNKRRLDPGSGPVIEVECPAVPIDRKCRFGCGRTTRRAHTHYVRGSDVMAYQPGVQTIPRIEGFLDA